MVVKPQTLPNNRYQWFYEVSQIGIGIKGSNPAPTIAV